ncbi:hypothetical protein ACU8KH_03200 [Lachancea thermotolerans]
MNMLFEVAYRLPYQDARRGANVKSRLTLKKKPLDIELKLLNFTRKHIRQTLEAKLNTKSTPALFAF